MSSFTKTLALFLTASLLWIAPANAQSVTETTEEMSETTEPSDMPSESMLAPNTRSGLFFEIGVGISALNYFCNKDCIVAPVPFPAFAGNVGLGFHYSDTTAFVFKYLNRTGKGLDHRDHLDQKIEFITNTYMIATQHWLGDRFWIQYGLAITDLDIFGKTTYDDMGVRIRSELPIVPAGFSVHASIGFEIWNYQRGQSLRQYTRPSFLKRLFSNQYSAHIELAANSALFQASSPQQIIDLNNVALNLLFRF